MSYYFNRTYTKETIDTSCIRDRLKTDAISSGTCERSQHVEETTELKELRGLQHSGSSALIWTYKSYNRQSNPSSSRNDAQQRKINSHKNKPTWSKVFEDNPACSSSRLHTFYEQNGNDEQEKKINSHKNKPTLLQNAKIVSMKPISWDYKKPSEETGKQTEVEDEEFMVRMEQFRLKLENIFSEGVRKLWSEGFPGDHRDNSLSVENKITTIKKPIYQNFQDSLENSPSKVVPPSNSSSDDSIDEKIIKMKAKKATADKTSERAFRAISWEPKIHKFSMKLDDIINSEMYSKDSLECSSEISNDSSSVASAISYFMRLKDFNESPSPLDENIALNEQPEDDLGSYEEFEALLLRRSSDSMSKKKSHEL